MDHYDLTLGLPQTNHNGLAEHLLLMYAGHFHWTSIARAIGKPLSTLRTPSGQEVYATFYFIEEQFPAEALIKTFKLDDRLWFRVHLRAFKGISIEGRLLFDRDLRLPALQDPSVRPPTEDVARHPNIRLGSIFITPAAGNSRLRVAAPANADFSALVPLPNTENPYHLTRAAADSGRLDLLDNAWECLDLRKGFEVPYAIDPDRDSNGAGLVYFANYVAFMDFAERVALQTNSLRRFSSREVAGRAVQHRRVAYYGNANLDDQLCTQVSLFVRSGDERRIGLRYVIRRREDGQLICLSESIKVLG